MGPQNQLYLLGLALETPLETTWEKAGNWSWSPRSQCPPPATLAPEERVAGEDK